jgi:hypothetical protein
VAINARDYTDRLFRLVPPLAYQFSPRSADHEDSRHLPYALIRNRFDLGLNAEH